MFDGVVATRHGKVRGVESDGCWAFRGIQYAKAPVGDLRFRPPQPPEPWTDVRAADAAGMIAPQPGSMLGSYLPGDPTAQDEDCLSVNVWTPLPDDGERPVMVYFHGGAYLIGSGAQIMYDGQHYAHRDVVLVTLNYRLGVLGYLAHPDLFDEESGGFGNWGLLDQIAALQWVHDNIANFGGDPNNVTIFGESAGGMSVSDLLGTPKAKGLFRRAIAESGASYATLPAPAAETAEQFARELGMTSVSREALSQVAIEDLLAAQGVVSASIDNGVGLPFRPVVDGGLLQRHPADEIADGCSAGVDLVTGTNRDEFKFFSVTVPELNDVDDEAVARIIRRYFVGSGLPEIDPLDVMASYRAHRDARGDGSTARDLLDSILTDWIFRIPQLRFADAQGESANTYVYIFDWESPFAGGVLGACHALEVPFVFGTVTNQVIGMFSGSSPAALALSDIMMDAWSSFAKTGVPVMSESDSDVPTTWPRYDKESRSTLRFGPICRVESDPYGDERAFWEQRLGKYGRGGTIEGATPASMALLAPAVD